MPQFVPFAVFDGETTPVEHTFSPELIDTNGVARWKESDGTPVGDNTLTMSLKKADTRYKGRMVLTMPVVVTETINGVSVPTVARTAYADVNVTFDKTSTSQERKNVLRILASALADSSTVDGAFLSLEGIY